MHGNMNDICPSWCVADHGGQQHEDDAWHESAGEVVPVVELHTVVDDDERLFVVVGREMEVRIERRVGEDESFIHFGVGEERARNFRLSIESTHRLLRTLRHALGVEGC